MSDTHNHSQQLRKIMSGNSESLMKEKQKGQGFKRTWPPEKILGNTKNIKVETDQKAYEILEDAEDEIYPEDTSMLSDLSQRSGDGMPPYLDDLEDETLAIFDDVNASQDDPPSEQPEDADLCQPKDSLPEEGDAETISQQSSYSTGKRENTPSLDDYFMMQAYLASIRSKDPVTQVGALVVKDDRNIGTGYNGMPKGLSDDEFSWNKGNEEEFDNKNQFVVHAEENAIDIADKNMEKGCTIYVTLFPCNKCARILLNKEFKEVVYMDDRDKTCYRASRLMLEKGGITCRQHQITPGALEQTLNKFNMLNDKIN